jgi:hypothetical protein
MTILHSDNGIEFINETMAHNCDMLGIRRFNTIPYHPLGNGLCERANQAIKRSIAAMVVEQGTKWHHALPLALWCLRSALHTSTGHSPFELLFGSRIHQPYDFATHTQEGDQLYNGCVEKLVIKTHEIFRAATIHTATAQSKYKAGYEQCTSQRTFFAGDLVLSRAFRTPSDEAPGEKFLLSGLAPFAKKPIEIPETDAPDQDFFYPPSQCIKK